MRTITNDDIREAYKRGIANGSLEEYGRGFYVYYSDEEDDDGNVQEYHCLIGEALTDYERHQVIFRDLNHVDVYELAESKIVAFEDLKFAFDAQEFFDCCFTGSLKRHLGL